LKKGLALLGLPVISIKEGREVGRVIDLLVAPVGLKLEFLLVGRQSKYIDLRLLDFSQVVGLGQYAVTVENEEQLRQIEAVPAARGCLEASVDIMDKMVLTRSGNLEGMIADIFFDEKSGAIMRLEYKDLHNDMRLQSLDSKEIISLGQDVLFMKERRQAHSKALNQSVPAALPPRFMKSGALLFKQKQRQFLMGKEVQKDIRDIHNHVIIPRGTVVTGDVLDVAEGHDRFSELTQWAK
jgi:uncharacterized protein YrrD